MAANVITIDVREELGAGGEPFARIMQAADRLRDGEALRILAPFEPVPLIGVLAGQGFSAAVSPLEDGGFEVIFTAAAAPDAADDLLS